MTKMIARYLDYLTHIHFLLTISFLEINFIVMLYTILAPIKLCHFVDNEGFIPLKRIIDLNDKKYNYFLSVW